MKLPAFLSPRIALSSLATHKTRTILAMLGVFLGALALTGVRHISEAMVRKAEIETEKLGPNLLMAMTGRIRFRRGDARTDLGASTFTLRDAEAIMRGLPGSTGGAPFLVFTRPLRLGSKKTMAQLVATGADYPRVRAFKPQWGRFFTAEEERDKDMVVVLGKTVAERLFGSPEAAVGKAVYLFRSRLKVIGVMEEKGSDVTGTNQDEQAFVPLSSFMRRMSNRTYIHGVYIQLADGADFEDARETARGILRHRRGLTPDSTKEEDFQVLTAKDTMKLKQEALDLVQTLGVISSSLSFAVGGLGILSIMVLLVRSRRLEIGVRRAVGARRSDIVAQFLFEAGAMSTTGGAAGVAAALVLLLAVYRLGDFPRVFDLWLILQALAGSAALGLAAGGYPAFQASRVEVLDVLREH